MRIRQALQEWDEDGLAAALAAVVVDVTGEPCSREAEHDIRWACRDMFWNVRQWPFGRASTTPLGETGLLFTCTLHTRPHKRLEVHVGSRDERLRERLMELDLDLHGVEVSRDRIASPPWTGEAGWTATPSPHVAPVAIPDRQRFAYALRQQAAHPPGPLMRRWEGGEHEAVWTDIDGLGEVARDDDVRLADVMHVVSSTMARCRHNLEAITGRLRELGLAVAPPAIDPDVANRIAALEDCVGPLPLTLCAWHQQVGAVDLRGFTTEEGYEAWRGVEALGAEVERADPLVVEPSPDTLTYDEGQWWQGRYDVVISPDVYHKFFVSGGPPYSVKAPTTAADGSLGRETFVAYLRRCMRFAGFPEVTLAPLEAVRAVLLGV